MKRLYTIGVYIRGVFNEVDLENRGGNQEGRLRLRIVDWSAKKTSQGCDVGYALAASSCEGANRVDACTVTALDAITAFTVPNPNCSSQNQSVFSGLVALRVAPVSRSLSLLWTGKVLIKPTLSAVDVSHLKQLLHRCQCFFASVSQISVDVNVENRNESWPSGNSM